MIFVHFVENAFKFASNKKIEHAISIRFDILEKAVSFGCKNHVDKTNAATIGNGGIGFQLIRQRLDLLYKKEYTGYNSHPRINRTVKKKGFTSKRKREVIRRLYKGFN